MSLEREDSVVSRHAESVIADADARATPVLDSDVDCRGTGVERVLDELLHNRGRSLDDLTRRDLIGDIAGKNRDARLGCG